jgi:cytochrome c biogenesis protein CcdA
MGKEIPVLRNVGYKLLLFCMGLIILFIILISLVSINVGFNNTHQAGFWIPILFGIFLIFSGLWGFIFLTKIILSKMRERDIISDI